MYPPLINSKHELHDDRVLLCIACAGRAYQDGALVECRDMLLEVIAAIDEFTEWEDKQNA